MIYSKVHEAMRNRELVKLWAKIDGKRVKGSWARVLEYLGESFYLVETRPDKRHLVVNGEDIITKDDTVFGWL